MPDCNHLLLVAALALPACRIATEDVDGVVVSDSAGAGPRVLCVVAHPDDEIAFAGTLYKTATHLRGTCDLAVITNGEGGYKYSTLGEAIYGLELTDPAVGRAHLPSIRREELIAACAILGVHEVFFLGQTDHRFTQDPNEVLGADVDVWDLTKVRSSLRSILDRGRYDFVLTHLPAKTSHGHHQAATILALEAIADLPRSNRPIALGAYGTGRQEEDPEPPAGLTEFPITRVRTDAGPFVFDRTQAFGFRDRLSYQIVINWAIAEHKSQGTFQLMMNRWKRETFRLYAIDAPRAAERAQAWFERLGEPQFRAPDYDENGARRPGS